IGNRVGVKLRDKNEYGVVVDTKHSVVSIVIGRDRIVEVRECDVFFDERKGKEVIDGES
ncbi:hypothetical protein LCGC14_1935820, partial [marine sediment metagenome]